MCLVPVEESKTIYNAFLVEEERRERKEREKQLAANHNQSPVAKKAGLTKKPGDKSERKKDKPVTLEEAVGSVSARIKQFVSIENVAVFDQGCKTEKFQLNIVLNDFSRYFK